MLQAQETNDIPLFYWHLNLQYVNDFQNGNLVLNIDDRYTYGLAAIFALNNWETFFQYRVLTDRYVSHTRIDEMQAGLRYTFGNLLSSQLWRSHPSHYNRRPEALYSWLEPFYLGFTLSGSYFQAGDIQGQSFQNQIHKLADVPQLYVQYLDSNYTVALGAEFYFAYTTEFRLSSWQTSRLELGLACPCRNGDGLPGNPKRRATQQII